MKTISNIAFRVDIEGHPGAYRLDCKGIKLDSSAASPESALQEMRGLLIDILRAGEPVLRAELEAEARE